MLSITELLTIDTKHLWLKISPTEQDKAWQQAEQYHSNYIARYNALLNHICWSHLTIWLEEWMQDESNSAISVWPSVESLPSIWEVVNGTAIQVGQTRLVLVPSDLNSEELRVPQEWVDIPGWTADYYIAVQVNLDSDEDESWIEISGFATHRQLKNQGIYNSDDRTYSLQVDQLTEDLTLLLVTLGLDFQEETPSLTTLSEAEARDLLVTLGNPSIYSPRLILDIPFSQWAAIVGTEQWRQQLYNQRLGHQEVLSYQEVSTPMSDALSYRQISTPVPTTPLEDTVVNLSQWFQQVFAAGWQPIDELLNTQLGNLAFDVRGFSDSPENFFDGVKLIDLGMQLNGQTLALLLALSLEPDEKIGVLVRLHPTELEKYLPSHLKLILVESGKVLQAVQSRSQDYYIQLNHFKGQPGTCFSIQLTLGDFSITENFSI